jgi:hypothetical protein
MWATFRLVESYSCRVIARNVTVRGEPGADASVVAKQLGEKLVASDLVLAIVFADCRLDPREIASGVQRVVGRAPVVGATAIGMISADPNPSAVALGLYGSDVRAGVGIAAELSKHALARSRTAVEQAATALGLRTDQLESDKHVAFTLVEGSAQIEESCCVGSATAAPQIRMVGGCASWALSETMESLGRGMVLANGEALADAGVTVILELAQPFEVITSSHMVPTEIKTVVTGASGRTVTELDGIPARKRFEELLKKLGAQVDPTYQFNHTFARIIDGVPYVRSIGRFEDHGITLGASIDEGHVLRIMRTGEVVDRTSRDLASAEKRLGGISALLAFSCVYREWEAADRGVASELAAVYNAYPTIGLHSFGEQTGMLFVNHTLTALAIGPPRG